MVVNLDCNLFSIVSNLNKGNLRTYYLYCLIGREMLLIAYLKIF